MNNKIILKSLIASSLIFSFANAQDDNYFELGFGVDKSSSEFKVPDDNTINKDSSETTPLLRFNTYTSSKSSINIILHLIKRYIIVLFFPAPTYK